MKYPLMEHAADQIRAANGHPLNDINLDALARGELSAEDLQIHADTLHVQAEIAREAGHSQLAANLKRAAELTRVPNEEILKMYEMLRPARASYEKLMELAAYLETTYQAAETARLVREAAEGYRDRGLLRR
jgi:propanediol dehydratase small subunit